MNAPSWIGKSLGGRYQIVQLLGQGGMSAVYKANDPNLKRMVAVKLIHSHLSDDVRFIRRFEEEAAAVAKLRHPNIVQVYDFNQDQGTFYMVLEFIPGETLQERLRRYNTSGRFLPLAKAVQYSIEILSALDYAHQRGMIHRDIKPANIMLNVHDQAILMDFGIVKMLEGESHTATGAVVGTARYMPPEVIRGELVDPRSDIYSYGITLYEMISGRPPFEADSAMTLMNMHLTDPVPELARLRPGTPPELVAVIERALHKERAWRFASASEMAQALTALLPRLAGVDDTLSTGVILERPAPAPLNRPGLPTEVEPARPGATEVERGAGLPTAHTTPPPGDWRTPAAPYTPPPTSTPPPAAPSQPYARPASPPFPSATDFSQPTLAHPSPAQAPPAYTAPGLSSAPATAPAPAAPNTLASLLRRFWIVPALLLVGALAFLGGSWMNGLFNQPSPTPTLDIQAMVHGTQTAVAALATPAASPTLEPSPTSVTQTPTPTITPLPPGTTLYIVQAGDTLSAIAQAFGVELPALLAANPQINPDTQEIQPGDQLNIPSPLANLPSATPTPELFVKINAITLEGSIIVVFYETFGYTENMMSTHVHFFFNTVSPENAGVPGSGPWVMYGGPRPFMGYKTSDRPAQATQMCALVANADHSVIPNSGTCMDLP